MSDEIGGDAKIDLCEHGISILEVCRPCGDCDTDDVPLRDFEMEQLRRELKLMTSMFEQVCTEKTQAEQDLRVFKEQLAQLVAQHDALIPLGCSLSENVKLRLLKS